MARPAIPFPRVPGDSRRQSRRAIALLVLLSQLKYDVMWMTASFVDVMIVDTAAGIVHLNDPGSEDGRDERVPIDVFVRSWDSSDDEMTVTA